MDAAGLIHNIADEDSTIPDIRQLLGYIHAAFGGTNEYAKMVVADLNAAPEGSSQRLSFHNNYLAAVAKFGGDDDVEAMDAEALEAEAQRISNEMAEDKNAGA